MITSLSKSTQKKALQTLFRSQSLSSRQAGWVVEFLWAAAPELNSRRSRGSILWGDQVGAAAGAGAGSEGDCALAGYRSRSRSPGAGL